MLCIDPDLGLSGGGTYKVELEKYTVYGEEKARKHLYTNMIYSLLEMAPRISPAADQERCTDHS